MAISCQHPGSMVTSWLHQGHYWRYVLWAPILLTFFNKLSSAQCPLSTPSPLACLGSFLYLESGRRRSYDPSSEPLYHMCVDRPFPISIHLSRHHTIYHKSSLTPYTGTDDNTSRYHEAEALYNNIYSPM